MEKIHGTQMFWKTHLKEGQERTKKVYVDDNGAEKREKYEDGDEVDDRKGKKVLYMPVMKKI